MSIPTDEEFKWMAWRRLERIEHKIKVLHSLGLTTLSIGIFFACYYGASEKIGSFWAVMLAVAISTVFRYSSEKWFFILDAEHAKIDLRQ